MNTSHRATFTTSLHPLTYNYPSCLSMTKDATIRKCGYKLIQDGRRFKIQLKTRRKRKTTTPETLTTIRTHVPRKKVSLPPYIDLSYTGIYTRTCASPHTVLHRIPYENISLNSREHFLESSLSPAHYVALAIDCATHLCSLVFLYSSVMPAEPAHLLITNFDTSPGRSAQPDAGITSPNGHDYHPSML